MGLFRTAIKFAFKPAVDVKSWLGYENLKNNTKSLYYWCRSLLVPKKTKPRKETFDQAVARLRLTEEDLAKKSRNFIFQAYLFLGVAFFCFIYAFYLFFKIKILAGGLVLILAAYLIIKAYLAHFWFFEIKHRKLGCSFKEWLHGEW
ncbi:MAG: type IVB secretion system protein IcmV [Gammaproteobacteria bacterium]|jgi:intracellular multiplication protein IcmV